MQSDLQRTAMAEIERMTITLPSDMAAVVTSAVKAGDYASRSEVVREALRDWKTKRALQVQELAALKADINRPSTTWPKAGWRILTRLGSSNEGGSYWPAARAPADRRGRS
jgi:putative addiction module CopG family antidote